MRPHSVLFNGMLGASGCASTVWHASRAAASVQRGAPAKPEPPCGVAADKKKTGDGVTPQLVVRELADRLLERIVERTAQQPVPAQSVERGCIDLAEHVETLALTKLQFSGSQERRLAGIRKPLSG